MTLLIVGRDPKSAALAAVDHKLNQALKKAAIVRDHCVVDLEARPAEIEQLVLTHQPKLVIALGNEASQVLLGPELWPLDKRGKAEGIQKIRGYLWDVPMTNFTKNLNELTSRLAKRFMTTLNGHDAQDAPPNCMHETALNVDEFVASGIQKHNAGKTVRVLTTLHPAACLAKRDPSGVWETYFKLDVKKAKKELELGCPPLPKRSVRVVTEPWEFQDVRNALNCTQRIAIDIENDGKLELSCLGVAVSRNIAFVIPAKTHAQMAFIREICESDKPKVLQNGQYDRLFLTFDHQHLLHGERQAESILVRNQTIDTMLQWHSLQPELAGAVPTDVRPYLGERSFKVPASPWHFPGSRR